MVTVKSRILPGSARSAVIETLLELGPTSRSSLADLTKLSRAALTEISHDLIELGLLYEIPVVNNRQRKGRPSVLLAVNAEHGYFVGVNIACSPALMVLADLHGNVISQHEIVETRSPQSLATSIQSGIQRMLASKSFSRDQVLGIGLALSGFVDHVHGICIHSGALNWADVPIRELVIEATGIPTCIGNDANAVATGEKLFGQAREAKNFCLITLGTTIGCAHYVGGRLYAGSSGGAGEIGHITMDPDGQMCPCGKRGCLDTIAGAGAILSAARAHGLQAETVAAVEALATNGDQRAIAILRKAGQALGLAAASSIQINNPELLLFADTQDFCSGIYFTTIVRQTIENNILPRFLSSTRIHFHPVKQSFLACGAAAIAAHNFLIEQAASLIG
jgi:predicted NBD/HSP70 family sugar kinase